MRRRQQTQAAQGTPQEQEPLQPEYPAGGEEEAVRESTAPSEAQPQKDSPVPPAAPKTRSRSRRRRGARKTASAQVASAAPKPQPLQPAYSDTEGPRAPIIAPLTPGGPTGEAAELGEPPEPQEEAPSAERETLTKRPRGAVILSVGLPGSGKTTWFKRHGVTPLSSDLLRSLLFDDPTEQRHQDLVFSSLRSLLRARLMARMPQNYVDATNLSPKERRHWVRMAHDFGYEAHAVYFDVPLETCMDRNRRRQRVVPEEVMHRMAAKLRPPTFEEGFSKIVVVRVKNRPGEAEAPTHLIEPPVREPEE
jgi:predicted kinase